jgi:hypothetical protein
MNLIRTKRRYRHRFLFLILTGLLILCLECGKKAPPVAPEATVPPAVKNLKAEVVGDKVQLTWSMPKKGKKVFEGLEHFGIYKYEAHSSVEMCPGCPIPFEHFVDIRLDDTKAAQVEGDRITWHDKIKSDHRYAYKIIVYHRSGGVSKDSNIVQFVVKPNLETPPRN